MPRFSARLFKTHNFGAPAQSLPRDLTLTPLTWSANDRGGPFQAECEATGSAESIAMLCNWLGDRLEIYNEMGQLLWWGDVWEIEVSLDHIEVRLSMDNVHNRVQIIYVSVLPDGTEVSRRSEWAEDLNSVDRYGRRELLYSLSSGMGPGGLPSVNNVRDRLLASFAYPGPIVSSRREAGFSARLIGQGTWYKASSIYFTNLKGLVESTDENGQQTLGRSITSTAIQFGVIDTEPEPDELVGGDEMTISGGGSFYPLKEDDAFTVRGAVAVDEDGRNNNDSYLVEAAPDTSKIIISGFFVAEAAGVPIQISWGYNQSQSYLAQSFKVASAWSATHIALKCRQLRNFADPDNPISPTDYLLVTLHSDASSAPGTQLAYALTLGASLYTELTWTEFVLTAAVPLSTATTYWIRVARAGSAGEPITPHLEDGYELALNELEGHDEGYIDGKMIVADPSGVWAERAPRADLCFRVIGEVDGSSQLTAALESVDSFSLNIVQLETGLKVRPYRDDGRTSMDELQELLEMGNSDGDRLISVVMPDRSVVVDVARPIEESEFTLGRDGRMRYANGSELIPGQLVYGQHVAIDTLLLLDGVGVRLEQGRSLYVQASSYDAQRDSLQVQSLGALDAYQALRIAQG